jgi:hypothetical protein
MRFLCCCAETTESLDERLQDAQETRIQANQALMRLIIAKCKQTNVSLAENTVQWVVAARRNGEGVGYIVTGSYVTLQILHRWLRDLLSPTMGSTMLRVMDYNIPEPVLVVTLDEDELMGFLEGVFFVFNFYNHVEWTTIYVSSTM